MKTRNPVAGNAWKYNKTRVIPNKKRGVSTTSNRYFEIDFDVDDGYERR